MIRPEVRSQQPSTVRLPTCTIRQRRLQIDISGPAPPDAALEWVLAWGNYVNLRLCAHDYPLRATMASIEARLDPARFVRVHRSYIVNLDFVQEIEPLDSGDARARMRDGGQVPGSRRYRDSLRKVAETGSVA